MRKPRPFLIGLTGSIGMGKSTTAKMFADEGVPVWDADAVVSRLYAAGGAAVALIRDICPEAITDGAVERGILRDWIARTPSGLSRLEQAVHPLVAGDRANFIETTASDIVVLDIPLLFETGAHDTVDAIVVVTAPAEVQRSRVMDREGMSEAVFETISAKQTPDAEKRQRADYVIESLSLEDARAAVQSCLRDIRRKLAHA